jgi:predicted lipoprotein with Yx(FWY)xxD motif
MTRTNWLVAASAAALLLVGYDAQTPADAQQSEEPRRQTEAETGDGGLADRFERAIGEAVESTREAAEETGTAIREGVRELDSEDAAEALRRGGEALGTAGERAGEYAERLAAQIERGDPTRLTVATSEEHGEFVADGEGWAVYMFEADTRGEEGTEAEATCYDDCAAAWPPLIVDEAPEADGQIEADLIDTIERRDGTMQVTYGGWPLYYYAPDEQPGDTTGHDIEDFGAEWYLVAPSGEQLHD